MKTMTRDICPHRLTRDPEECWSCAKDELLNDLGDCAAAVTAGRSSVVRDIRVKGGTPNWVPIDEQAASFFTDIVREGNHLLQRSEPVHGEVAVILAVHQLVDVTAGAGALLMSWRDRCRHITGASDRPYLLTHATTVTTSIVVDGEPVQLPRVVAVPTLCPVVDPQDERPCRSRLKVHPGTSGLHDSDDIPAGSIVCTRNRLHVWSRKQGWLRLSVLLKQAV